MKNKYIVIEGNIGAGKTSLATMLAEDIDASLVLENFIENPFLPKFYEDPKQYSLPLELSFLTERYHQLSECFPFQDNKENNIISDYFFQKSLLFARTNLSEDEYKLYFQLFNIVHEKLPKPDILIYIHIEVDKLLKNIKKRGRDYEKFISAHYLLKVQETYLKYLKSDLSFPVLLLDSNGLDFVNRREDYERIINILEKPYCQGINTIF